MAFYDLGDTNWITATMLTGGNSTAERSQAEQALAAQVMDELIGDSGNPIAQIDPFIIAILIKLLPVLLEILAECPVDTAIEANKVAKRAGPIHRWLLNRGIRKRTGRDVYRDAGGRSLGRAFINVAAKDDNVGAMTTIWTAEEPIYEAF